MFLFQSFQILAAHNSTKDADMRFNPLVSFYPRICLHGCFTVIHLLDIPNPYDIASMTKLGSTICIYSLEFRCCLPILGLKPMSHIHHSKLSGFKRKSIPGKLFQCIGAPHALPHSLLH